MSGGITLSTGELFLGGMAAFAVLALVVKARAGVKRARVAAEITRAGTSPVSLLGRVLVAAAVIVGVQWAVLTFSDNQAWVWVALGLPALVTAFTLTKALTVVMISPSQRRGGGRR